MCWGNVLGQHVAPTRCSNTLPQHVAPTRCPNTLPQHVAPTRCHNTLPQHVAPLLFVNGASIRFRRASRLHLNVKLRLSLFSAPMLQEGRNVSYCVRFTSELKNVRFHFVEK